MELTPKQQVVEILRNSQKILIFTHTGPDGDALGSLLALYLSLTKLGKEVTAVCEDLPPAVFGYLSKLDEISHDLNLRRDFVISLDVTRVPADKVMYKMRDGRLDIIITPKSGKFDSSDVSFPEGSFSFEAIIVLDSPDMERIGSVYEKKAEIFYELPVVNIDHHAGNTHFGKINLVDLTSTSTAEILVSVLEALSGDAKFIDEPIATALLTGIITDTNSFQNANTTPKSLTVAAQLVAAGGRQQEIIKSVYKTKPLSTLRLWGRALSNLRDEKDYRFVWSEIRKKDYLDVGAGENESSGVVDELLKTAVGIDFALLLSEKNGDVHGSLRSTTPAVDVSAISKLLGGGGHPMAAAFQLPKTTLLESSSSIIQRLREYQRERERAAQSQVAGETIPLQRAE